MLALIIISLVSFTIYATVKAVFSWGQVAGMLTTQTPQGPQQVTIIQKNVYYQKPVQYNSGIRPWHNS